MAASPPAEAEAPDPRYLTQWIKNTKNVKELLELQTKHGRSWNHIHISAAWMALSRHLSGRARASASRAACSAGVSDGVPMAPSLTTVGLVLGPLAFSRK